MSSVRLVGANRAADQPDRMSNTTQVNALPGTASFPEALGAAANTMDAPQTGMPPRRHPEGPVANSTADPAHGLPAADITKAIVPNFAATNSPSPAAPDRSGLNQGASAVLDAAGDSINPSQASEPLQRYPAADGQQVSPAQMANRQSQQHSTRQTRLRDPGIVANDPVAAPTTDPANASLGGLANAKDQNAALLASFDVGTGPKQPPAQISEGDSQSYPPRPPLQRIGGRDIASDVIDVHSSDPPYLRRHVERSAGSSVDDGTSGSLIVAPLIGDIRPADLPISRAKPEVTRDTLARAASPFFLAERQRVAVADVASVPATDPTGTSPVADPAGAPLRDVSAFGIALSGSSGTGPAPDASMRTIMTAVSPASVEDVTAPFRPAPRSGETFHSTTPGGETVDARSVVSASNAPAGSPVEVSAGSAASNSSPTDLADQLSYHLIRSADSGGHEFVLRLHPPELGDLTVRVLVSGREVSAWFASPQMQVQQAISQGIGQLHIDLGNAGYNLSNAWVGGDAWSPGERDGGWALPQQQQRGSATRPRPDESQGRPTPSVASGVSVYV